MLEKGQLSQEMDIEVIEYKRTAYSESYIGNDFKFINRPTILVQRCFQNHVKNLDRAFCDIVHEF